MHSKSLLIVAGLVVASAGCPGGDGKPDPVEPTFENVVERVLTKNCTFASCHANPTVAAALDLTPELACDALVSTPSCLFPERKRIVPFSPDESFFLHKLTGQGLDETSNTDCAPSNVIMPLGAAALPDEDLQLVRDWIAAGAECVHNPDMKPLPGAPPEVAGLAVSRNAPIAGETVTITVTLNKNAGDNGQMVEIESTDDPVAISSPVQVVVPPQAAVVAFEVYALRPTPRFTLRAKAGQSSREVVLRIGGLDIAEVHADPTGTDDNKQWIKLYNRTPLPIDLSAYELRSGVASYDVIMTQSLTGTLSPGACAVIGGTRQTAPNEPIYWQAVNFTPDLQHPLNGGAGFAVFDRLATPIGGIATPVDTMIIGSNNAGGLRGPDAEVAPVSCSTPAQSLSALRIPNTNGCVQAAPTPSSCP
jgi:Lamin Tail Domain